MRSERSEGLIPAPRGPASTHPHLFQGEPQEAGPACAEPASRRSAPRSGGGQAPAHAVGLTRDYQSSVLPTDSAEDPVLVTAGANMEARDDDGNTPLHDADYPALVEALVAAGANLEARDQRGRTPLHHAATAPIMLDTLTSSRDSARDRRVHIEALVAAGANLEARDEAGNTPLHHAAADDKPALSRLMVPHSGHAIEALLDAGANAMARNVAGETAWDIAQTNETLQGSDGYWRLNDARFNAPGRNSRRRSTTRPERRQSAVPEPRRRQGPACELPGYPTPANVQTLGLNWCGSNVGFQRRAFALQAAGAWCAIAEGTSSSPEQVDARHREINAACDSGSVSV